MIQGDTGQIEQCIMNLVINARDAMPEGGDLLVKTENVLLDRDSANVIPDAQPGPAVRLSIEDSGSGMTKETLAHIFEPFFTTKGEGKGTGLGLAVVYGIVKQHGGWINVYSEPGNGTRFSLYFPAQADSNNRGAADGSQAQVYKGQGGRVLLVEDDEGIKEATSRGLARHGYVLFAASSIQEAQAIYERERGDFQLVISDAVLSDGSGVEFVEHLRSEVPSLPVLLCSGYANRNSQWAQIEKKGYPFLQKPYNLASLTRAIRQAMSGQGSQPDRETRNDETT
jgi:CheY-like chemotaxis protein